jgi:SAM-dependent methyltransferase
MSLETSTASRLHHKAWAESYKLIDLQLSPLGLRAMQAIRLTEGDTVVDVGCGTGQTLLQLADIVGSSGHVTGVDIAAPLLDVAAQRTRSIEQIDLLEADAQNVPLQTASADAIFSRFGIMSFADPITAFTNFRRILKPSGTLAFVCWRAFEENELDHLPLRAAGFGSPASDTPFSFANPDMIRGTLTNAGFTNITMHPFDHSVSSGGLDEMTDILMKTGPLGKIIREDPDLQTQVTPRLRDALSKRADTMSIALDASVWIVSAQ